MKIKTVGCFLVLGLTIAISSHPSTGEPVIEKPIAKVVDSAVKAEEIKVFNDKDITEWTARKNDKTRSPLDAGTASRFSVKDGVLFANRVAEGVTKVIQRLDTNRQFPGNWELKLEFRAEVNADSGLFLRGPQLQVRDYLVAGPYKKLKNFKPQDWNEIIVIVKDNVAHCTCNGEVLEEALKIPADGPIGVEADRGQVEYRNMRLKMLP